MYVSVRPKSIDDLQATLVAAGADALAGAIPLPGALTKYLRGLLTGAGTDATNSLKKYLELTARVPIVVEYHATADELRYHLEGVIDVRPTQHISVVVDATSCSGPRGPWTGTIHSSHPPEGANDPPSDHLIPVTWTFDRAGKAVLVVGPTTDITFGRRHTVVLRATLRLLRGTHPGISVIELTGEEDGTQTYALTDRFDAAGVMTTLLPGCR